MLVQNRSTLERGASLLVCFVGARVRSTLKCGGSLNLGTFGYGADISVGVVADFAFLPIAESKISTSFLNAAILSSPTWSGDAGAGVSNTTMRYRAACIAASVDFIPGIRTAF